MWPPKDPPGPLLFHDKGLEFAPQQMPGPQSQMGGLVGGIWKTKWKIARGASPFEGGKVQGVCVCVVVSLAQGRVQAPLCASNSYANVTSDIAVLQ